MDKVIILIQRLETLNIEQFLFHNSELLTYNKMLKFLKISVG